MSTFSVKLTAKPADRNIGLSWTLPRNFKNSNNYKLNYIIGRSQMSNSEVGGLELLFSSNSSKYIFRNDISNNTKDLLNNYPYGLYLTAYDISGIPYESNRISSAPVGKNNGILLTPSIGEESINLNWTFKTGRSSVDNYYYIYLVSNVTKLSDFVSKNNTNGIIYDTDPITTNNYLVEDLSNNTSYGLFLTTQDASYNTIQSDLFFVTPSNGIVLTAKPSNQKVILSWKFNKGFASSTRYSFLMQRNVTNLDEFYDPTFFPEFTNLTNTYNYGPKDNNVSYGFVLLSYDASNNQQWHSNVVFSIPVPEQNIKVTGTAGDKKISLKWTFSKTATTDKIYKIYDISNVEIESFTDISNTKIYNLTDLSNNISYGLYLKTQDLSGEYISNKIFVTPKPAETLTLTGKANVRKIDLSWKFKNNVITSDTNYDLYYVANAKTAAQFNNGTVLNINFTDISNKSYQFNQDISGNDLSGNVSYGMYLHTQDASNNEFISKIIFATPKR
jgi:hypothetical protein